MSSAVAATAAGAADGPALPVARAPRDRRILGLYALFFLSGFPALLYQVVWQRALFTIYGVNVESVTVVVSAFMLGLGLGSLGGGWLSERHGVPLLAVFGVAELGIGLFGALSLSLFRYVAQYTAGSSALGTGAITFALLLIPTALMGGTLPILTAHLVRISGNVGRSVGSLYFVNTLGSATACFCAVVFVMDRCGESGSVRLAAAINTIVGASVLILHCTLPKAGAGKAPLAPEPAGDSEAAAPTLAFHLAVWVAGLAGLVSLAYEILWYRAFSLAYLGRAPAFAVLLGFYLTGIAFGGRVSGKLCRKMSGGGLRRHLRNLGLFLIVANVVGYLVVPALGFLLRYHPGLALPLVSLATMLLGAAFPLISHAAVSPDARAGRGLSRLYVSNIIGSTLGSLIVGYVLMDVWGMRQIAIAIALTGIALGAAILVGSAPAGRPRTIRLASCAALLRENGRNSMVSAHLRPGGAFLYNLTGSQEAQLTGITVFPHGVMVGNNLVVSNQPLQLDRERWKRVMEQYRIDGAPVFDLNNPEHVRRFQEVAAQLPTREETETMRARNTATRIITDDNMGVEWRKVE